MWIFIFKSFRYDTNSIAGDHPKQRITSLRDFRQIQYYQVVSKSAKCFSTSLLERATNVLIMAKSNKLGRIHIFYILKSFIKPK